MKISAMKSASSIGIIGGADGPTSIFIAGKVTHPVLLYVVSGLLVAATVIYFIWKHKSAKK